MTELETYFIGKGELKIISEKEIYPKTKDFGKTGWCFNDFSKAIVKFNFLNN